MGGHVRAVGVELEEGGHDADEWCHGNIAQNELVKSSEHSKQDSAPKYLE